MYENISRGVVTDNLWLETRSEICSMERHLEEFITNLGLRAKRMPVFYIIRKYVLNIWSEHNYIFSHRIVHTTTCFGPVYWPSSGCIINLTSSYTIRAWGTLGGTRSRLTVVGGMASGSLWTGVNIICQCLGVLFQTC